MGLPRSLLVVDDDEGDGVGNGEQAQEDWHHYLEPVLQSLGWLHLLYRDQAEDAHKLKVDDEDDNEAHHEPDVEEGGVGHLGDDLPDALVEFEDVDEGDEGHAAPCIDGDGGEEKGAVGSDSHQEGGQVLLSF